MQHPGNDHHSPTPAGRSPAAAMQGSSIGLSKGVHRLFHAHRVWESLWAPGRRQPVVNPVGYPGNIFQEGFSIMKKETYEFRKAQGLCVVCGTREAISGQTLCQLCKENRTYYRRKKAGLCPTCGAAPLPGSSYCQSCIDERIEEQEWYRAHGICQRCHQADALIGSTLCYDCNEKNILRCQKYVSELSSEQIAKRKDNVRIWRNARYAAGRCINCGRPLVNRKFKMCAGCRAYNRNIKREMSTAPNYAQLGLCRRCGKQPVEGYSFCEQHLKEARQRAEQNFRPFGKPIADLTYWMQLNHAVFLKKKP